MSSNLIDAANFAVQQAPATTKFVTNKMCPFAQKVWIALEAAGAPYEMAEVGLYGADGKPDWFWDLNPDGTVPVLVCHGGAVVYPDSDLALDKIGDGSAVLSVEGAASGADSLLIISKQNPDEKTERRIKQWRRSINNMLPIAKKAVLGGSRSEKDKLWGVLKEIDADVVGPYLCGESVTVADCAAFPFLWRLNDEFGADELGDYDNLQAWLKTCNANPAFSKTVQSSWWWWW